MSAKTLSLERDICRCCLLEGSFIDLAQPYEYYGKEEVYYDMLKDVFNIEVRPVPGKLCVVTYKICETCIQKLRDAFLFREQVISSEIKFKEMYERSVSEVKSLGLNSFIKEEDTGSIGIKDDISSLNSFGDEDSMKVEDEMDDSTEILINKFEDVEDDIDSKFDDDEDESIAEIKAKKRTKGKTKPPPDSKQKGKRTKKAKEEATDKTGEAEGSTPKKKKGGWKKFVLRQEDYKQEGNAYHCSHCGKVYEKLHSLRYHLKSRHYKTPGFSCPVCLEEFMTLARFTAHKLEVHSIDDRFKCNACKGAFNTRVQLRKHINTYHMMGQKHKCEHCKYESFSYEGLYKHKFKHKLVKDHHCRFCRKSFLRKANLELHERIHTGDRRKVCKVCGQAFVQKASLNYHMAKYHPSVNF